jgi:nicotinate dehydrogenase subunit A
VNGRAIRSCVTPVNSVVSTAMRDAAGRNEIVTLEGLGTAEQPHPIQQAFIDEQAVQCGFCLSGVILTAKALLDRNPRATDADVQQELSAVLCRCFVNLRFMKAIRRYADGRRG